MLDSMHPADTRYNRQEMLPEIGEAGQELLRKARVLVIGAGGVKSPLLYYLAAAGVGFLRIVDFDRVELSNLNRQILYTTDDIGRFKSEAAASRLAALNPEITIESVVDEVSEQTIDDHASEIDFIVEGGDSPQARRFINEYCVRNGRPFIHTSAMYNFGHVFTYVPGVSDVCFACIFPDQEPGMTGAVPSFGVATGVAGTLGASQVINYFLGNHRLYTDGFMSFSLFHGEFRFIPCKRRVDCEACQCISSITKP